VRLVESIWDAQNRSFKKGAMVCICAVSQDVGEAAAPEEEDPLGMEVIDATDCRVFRIGTVAKVLQLSRVNSGENFQFSLLVEGVARMKIEDVVSVDPFNTVRLAWLSDEGSVHTTEVRALTLNVQQISKDLLEMLKKRNLPSGKKIKEVVESGAVPGRMADLLAANLDTSVEEKQTVLCELGLEQRLRKVMELINRQLEVFRMSEKIQTEVDGKLKHSQREYYLRQQLRAINQELGSMGGSATGDMDEMEILQNNLLKAQLSEEARNVADREFQRLKQMQPSQPEYSVIRNYLELLAELPWAVKTEDNLDVANAKMVLDRDHHSLDKVKNRLIEFLAVRSLKNDMKGPIICLVGPPGVGKTSLGKSVAEAVGRKFRRLALGGVRDEAEIRGHRRTYIGAMPGNIVNSIKKAGSINPVILLDEVDKLGKDTRGDPGSALLEVLDPEQNDTFVDHYLNVPMDLSKVLFIATANSLDTIPSPLLDRMEVIELPGYTTNEKFEITTRHLVPKQMERHGVNETQVSFTPEAIRLVIESYTREAGVRNVDREIAALCRYAAVLVAQSLNTEFTPIVITPEIVVQVLGPNKYESEIAQRTSVPGVATGLAWTPVGGQILFIEAWLHPGTGRVQTTGQLGKVMEESVRAALSLVRGNLEDLGLSLNIQKALSQADLHVHFPAGGIPKDGPSAGVAITAAVLSALSGNLVRADTACTGEITLRGLVLPVGGIKEKVMAAHRAGIRRVILPHRNAKDIEEIPLEVRNDLEIFTVQNVVEAMRLMFDSSRTSTLPRWLKEVEDGKSATISVDGLADTAGGIIPYSNL